MADAIKGSLSANKAADLHGVPRSTLKDRLSGRVAHGVKSGPRLTYQLKRKLSYLPISCRLLRLDWERHDEMF